MIINVQNQHFFRAIHFATECANKYCLNKNIENESFHIFHEMQNKLPSPNAFLANTECVSKLSGVTIQCLLV